MCCSCKTSYLKLCFIEKINPSSDQKKKKNAQITIREIIKFKNIFVYIKFTFYARIFNLKFHAFARFQFQMLSFLCEINLIKTPEICQIVTHCYINGYIRGIRTSNANQFCEMNAES